MGFLFGDLQDLHLPAGSGPSKPRSQQDGVLAWCTAESCRSSMQLWGYTQQWNLSGSQHLWIIYLCTTAGRPARAFKPGEQVSGSQDGCVFLNGVSGCIWRVGGPGCSMASVSRLAVLIGKIVINDNSISVKIWRYLIFRHTHTIPHNHTHNVLFNFQWKDMGMDQYLLIPFLGGWTSIYQLFWCSPGVQGFDTLPYLPSGYD